MAKQQYFGVNGVARKTKSMFFGVNGVAKNIKNGYIGTNGVARQFLTSSTPISSLAIGTIVKLKESGTPQEYIIVNNGIPSGSSLYDSSCNGTWLLRKDIINDMLWVDTSASKSTYQRSNIHRWLQNNMLTKYDLNIQNIIKEVKIPYVSQIGYTGPVIQSGSNGLSCKVFLLSGYELGWTSSNAKFPQDGAKLSYFLSGTTSDANNKRISFYKSTAYNWATRSNSSKNSLELFDVESNGSFKLRSVFPGTVGVRPTLILPSDVLVDSNKNIIVS